LIVKAPDELNSEDVHATNNKSQMQLLQAAIGKVKGYLSKI